MEDRPPLEFANRVIRKFVDNFFGAVTLVTPQDYTTMRVAFRNMRGDWKLVLLGDDRQLQVLSQVVQAWGNTADKSQRAVEVGY